MLRACLQDITCHTCTIYFTLTMVKKKNCLIFFFPMPCIKYIAGVSGEAGSKSSREPCHCIGSSSFLSHPRSVPKWWNEYGLHCPSQSKEVVFQLQSNSHSCIGNFCLELNNLLSWYLWLPCIIVEAQFLTCFLLLFV